MESLKEMDAQNESIEDDSAVDSNHSYSDDNNSNIDSSS